MAYAVPIDTKCTEHRCTQIAVYEVYNGSNAVVRRCCWRHAEDLVKRLSEQERARRG